MGYPWVILGLRASIFADCPCLHLNALKIAFTRLHRCYPLRQIKSPYRANFCVIIAYTHGKIAIASCIRA